MVPAGQRFQAFGKADKAHCQRAVPEHVADLVVRAKLFRVNPDALPHQEGVIAHLFVRLDGEARQQLVDNQVKLPVEVLKEEINVPMAADGNPWEIDGSKT